MDASQVPPPADALSARVVKGAGWTLASKLTMQSLELAKVAVMGGILTEHDFGLFAIAMLAYVTVETFSQTGFAAALIQRKEDTRHYLDTAWTFSAIRGLVLAGILFFAAPLVAWFFEEPQTANMLRLVSVTAALDGFTNVALMVHLQKSLNFRRQFVFEISGTAASFAVFVVLVLTLRNAWALVWGNFAMFAVKCIMSYVLDRYRPTVRLDRAQIREMFSFGRWMLGQSILIFLWQQGTQFFVGKFLGRAELGVMTAGNRINQLGPQVSLVTGNVMFPAYAKVQDDKSRLGRGFLDLLGGTMSLVVPVTLFVIVAAGDILQALLPKWCDTAEKLSNTTLVVQVLAVASLVRALDAAAVPLLIGVGKPYLDVWRNGLCVAVMAVTIYPLSEQWGLVGASVSLALGAMASASMWHWVRREAHVSWSQIGRCMLPGLALGAATLVVLLAARFLLKPHLLPEASWLTSGGLGSMSATRLAAAISLAASAALALAVFLAMVVYLGKIHKVGPYLQLQRVWRSFRKRS